MKSIKEEYAAHVVPDEFIEKITHPYYLVLNMEDIVKRLEKEERTILRKRRRNRIAQNIFKGNLDILKEEEQVFEEILALIDDNINIIGELSTVITDDNFLECIKLVDFLVSKYSEHMSYYNGKLEGLNQAMNGIGFVDNRYSNRQTEVKDFMNDTILSMKKQKQLEKTTKI